MQDSFVLKETESRLNQPYNVLGMDVYLKVSGKDTNNQLSMFSAEYCKNQVRPCTYIMSMKHFTLRLVNFCFR